MLYLSVQLFDQSDVSGFGVDPEVLFGPGVKGKAIHHLLALRVCAVETVDLCT